MFPAVSLLFFALLLEACPCQLGRFLVFAKEQAMAAGRP